MFQFTSPDTGKIYDIKYSTHQRGFSQELTHQYDIYDNGNWCQQSFSESSILEQIRCYEQPTRWDNIGSRFD